MTRRYVHLPLPVPTLAEVVLAVLLGLSLFGRGCSVPDWLWPAPAPAPPAPEPEPTPVVTGRLWVSYVVPGEPTPAQAAIRTSKALRDALATLDCEWRTYSEAEEDVTRLRLAPYVTSLGLPCVIVQGKDGAILAKLPQPDEAAILREVGRLRGK